MAPKLPDDADPEQRRVYALLDELTADPGYVDGAVPFRGQLTVEDARFIAADIHVAVDQGTDQRDALIVRAGSRVACYAGCNSCCAQVVMIWSAEAELIAEWLRAPAQTAIREAFLAAYPAYRDAIGDSVERIRAGRASGDPKNQLKALMLAWRKGVLCAFNVDGKCAIYPVRPALCRHAHAVDRSDLCRPSDDDQSTPATSMSYVPLEEFMKKVHQLANVMHHALGEPRKRQEGVCEAVYRRLTRDESAGS